MSHPEGEGAQSGADGTQSGAGESTTGTGTDPTTDTTTQGGSETATTDESAKLAEQYRDRMRAADQRAAKFEAELQQIRDKDLPEAEKLKRDFDTAQKQVVELQDSNKRLALENAFLKDNTYGWHNPDRALKLVDLSQVEIQSDGSVAGLKDALKALATSDPYLIKQQTDDSKPQQQGGTAPGNNGNSSTSKPNAAKMVGRLPALGSRVRRS